MALSMKVPAVKDPFQANLDCIHCGLCLAKCPTYQVLGNEADSPRGRIYLMRALENGRIELDTAALDHIEGCLGCRACESACPSGVRYELILNQTKGRIFREEPSPTGLKLAFRQLLPHPGRLRLLGLALRLYQNSGIQWLVRKSRFLGLLPGDLADSESKLPRLPRPERLQESYSAYGESRHRVALLTGCVMPIFFPGIQRATVEVLRHSGCDVYIPAAQRCCGALHIHGGDRETAARLALHNLSAFEGFDAVIVNSAGCGAAMKEYDHLFEEGSQQQSAAAFSGRVRDVSEFLAEIELPWTLRRLPIRVAYDDACHLLHGQRVSAQPRRLLQQIPSLTLPEVANADRCCGSAGIYNLLRPEMADRLLEMKLDEILAVKPDRVATGNPGCLLQIQYGLRQRGLEIPVQHPVEILLEALS